jgi:hypothetical protein
MNVKIGDLILCRGELVGIVIKIEIDPPDDDSVVWGKIMWSNGSTTWEDMLLNINDDNIFEIISERNNTMGGKNEQNTTEQTI